MALFFLVWFLFFVPFLSGVRLWTEYDLCRHQFFYALDITLAKANKVNSWAAFLAKPR